MIQAAIDILRDLIAFDTTSHCSNLSIIDYIEKHFANNNIASTRLYNEAKNKASVIATLSAKGKTRGGVLLSGHTDTVPVEHQTWNSDPFTLTKKDGKLFGRGTADMKGFVALCLAMLPELSVASLKEPIHFCFSYDEEIGCLAAPALAQFIRQHNLEPTLAIIGEPTEMKVVTSHKGILTFETTVTGYEAHSSLPHLGVNAVEIAAELVHFLSQMAKEYETARKQNTLFTPSYSTIHVGVIHGGTARNIIPKECCFIWEIRMLPEEDGETIFRRFEAYARGQEQKMKAHFPQTSITTRRTSQNPALHHRISAEQETLLLAASNSNRFHTLPFMTEAGVLQSADIPCVICGPGSIEQAHKPDEYISVTQLEEGLAFLKTILKHYCYET